MSKAKLPLSDNVLSVAIRMSAVEKLRNSCPHVNAKKCHIGCLISGSLHLLIILLSKYFIIYDAPIRKLI